MKNFVKKWLIPSGWLELVRSMPRLVSLEKRRLLKQNERLFNKHKGERCFILGAGSSINKQNLKQLVGECVISVNNTFVHPDYPVIKPRYHVSPRREAPHPKKDPYVEPYFREMDLKTLDAEIFLHIADKKFMYDNDLFSNRCVHWFDHCIWDEKNCDFSLDLSRVPAIWSVSELAIQIALYMGFEKIYLLGFDHDWFNGLFVYFFDHSQHVGLQDTSPYSEIDSEFQMRRHAYIFKKYKCLYNKKKNIFNANADPNSYVDAFPKVDFDSLFI